MPRLVPQCYRAQDTFRHHWAGCAANSAVSIRTVAVMPPTLLRNAVTFLRGGSQPGRAAIAALVLLETRSPIPQERRECAGSAVPSLAESRPCWSDMPDGIRTRARTSARTQEPCQEVGTGTAAAQRSAPSLHPAGLDGEEPLAGRAGEGAGPRRLRRRLRSSSPTPEQAARAHARSGGHRAARDRRGGCG